MRAILVTLETDADARASFVEKLRCAASLLDGTAPDGVRERAALRVAVELRHVAFLICDHARVSSNGACRYCDGVVR